MSAAAATRKRNGRDDGASEAGRARDVLVLVLSPAAILATLSLVLRHLAGERSSDDPQVGIGRCRNKDAAEDLGFTACVVGAVVEAMPMGRI